jgi:hypothetical protein
MKSVIVRISPVLLVVLIALVFANLHLNRRSSQTDNCFNICGDARGYYAWLPAIFIYHDLNFKFFDSVEMKEANCGAQVGIPIQDYRYTLDGRAIDKYYPGTSFMMLPFFATAHFATKFFTYYPADGYSPLYFKVMGLAGVFYYLIGMLFFLGILRQLALNTLQKILSVLLASFGTNIIYYAIDAPVYSHIYSFTLIAAFLYWALCLKNKFSLKYIAFLSFITGWIFVARSVNISVVLVLPFLFWGQMGAMWNEFRERAMNFVFLLPVLIMPVILFSLYKAATGHYFVYSYGDEGFDFLHPHLWQFLTSYDNGIVPYMPLLFMPLVFIAAWYKRENRHLILGLFVTLAVTIYIHSSWWAWAYGFSFGARTILDFVPLFGVLIGLSLKQANLKRYLYLLTVYVLCCGLTVILYHQKSHGGYMAKYPITDYKAAITNALGVK